jgi:hypothetical protein
MKILNQTGAIQAGCDVWILADPVSSAWTRKLDWYLNFQIRRSRVHKPAQLSAEIIEVMKNWDFEADEVKVSGSGPLMVASSKLLPNRQSVVVALEAESDTKVSSWVKSVHRICKDLCFTQIDQPGRSAKKIRVFLPGVVSVAEFRRHWPDGENDARVELAADELLIKGV